MQLQFSNIYNKNSMFDNTCTSLKSEDWCTYKTFVNLPEMTENVFYHVSHFSTIFIRGLSNHPEVCGTKQMKR